MANRNRGVDDLTNSQERLLRVLAATAGADKEVAEILGWSHTTVRTYIAQIRDRLIARGYDVKSRYNLISWAKEWADRQGGE